MKFIPIEAHSHNHDVNDKRKPTAYHLEVNGAIIGTVHSQSRSSWRMNRSRMVRTTFRGYSRNWIAVGLDGRKYSISYSRRDAAQWLVEEAGKKGACNGTI